MKTMAYRFFLATFQNTPPVQIEIFGQLSPKLTASVRVNL